MLNYNGTFVEENHLSISYDNRAFKYGDSIFETLKVKNNKVIFWEDHYFRLISSMRMLRMKIPMEFTLEYLESQIKDTAKINLFTNCRVRLSIFRKDGGYYKPKTNEIDFLIEVSELNYQVKSAYKIDVYKDFYNYSGHLSTIKTTNTMINTLASIFAEENDLDNCVLINERKGVVEVTNGNIFIVKGNKIKTPSLTEGCLKGIVRGKVIKLLEKKEEFTIEQTSITPFEIQKADEAFITNSIIGIQPITNYKKKQFITDFSYRLANELQILEITSN